MTREDWLYDELVWMPDRDSVVGNSAKAPRHQAVAPRATNALGIDVSKWQGSAINWQQVASTRQFCYIKATEGVGYVSATLDSQWNGARAAGLVCGLYHFATPSNAPEADADEFSAQVNRLQAVPGCLPPCLDLETGSGDLSNWASRFIARLRANTGCVRVMVYSSASFFQNQIREDWMDQNVAIWIAHFGRPPGQPAYLTPRVAIHQYADNGRVNGINGNVDLDFAVWPLSTIVPDIAQSAPPPANNNNGASQVSVLTPDEQSKLTACMQQLSGSPNVGEWIGWPGWPGGSGRSLTPVDYLRLGDVQNCTTLAQITALRAELDEIKSAIGSLAGQGVSGPATLSDADVNRIAAAVVAMFAQRMSA